MLSGLYIVCIALQLAYALYFFARILFPRRYGSPHTAQHGVSVIICARNESANLRKNLPAVLSQQYADASGKIRYEVIVVNDGSADDTDSVLRTLQQQYGHLRVVTIPAGEERTLKGKKFALSRGAAQAAFDCLLLTDADCMLQSDEWLQHMAGALGGNKQIVAGYGGYELAPGLLNAFIRWETLHTFLQYSTYARAGLPYMAVGRNMACTKQILLQAQHHELWNRLPSGDDDMLVRIMGNGHNVAVVAEAESFTRSAAKETWAGWIKQKQRHLSTGKYYKTGIKLLLGAYSIAHALMWVLFFLLLYTGYLKIAGLLLAARCLVYWSLWAVTAMRLCEKDLILWFPLFDIGWAIYNFAFLPYITWKNKDHWT